MRPPDLNRFLGGGSERTGQPREPRALRSALEIRERSTRTRRDGSGERTPPLVRERLLAAGRSREPIAFAACPASDELLRYVEQDLRLPPFRRREVKSHLLRCDLCREEAEWAAGRITGMARGLSAGWLRRPWTWAAAAAMLAVLLAMMYPSHFGPRRFARHAQLPDLPCQALIAEFGARHPDDLPRFRAAAQLLSLGLYGHGRPPGPRNALPRRSHPGVPARSCGRPRGPLDRSGPALPTL
jgi:hypothetical protein